MEQAAFNAMMEKEFSSNSQKRAGLNNAATEKRTNFRPIEQAKIDYIADADTFALAGQDKSSRLTGYDAYETYHKDNPTKPSVMNRQKQRYAQEFGKDVGSVTDNDIYKQGARKGLQSLHEMARKEGDAPWTPGPISEEWYTEAGGPQPAQLGSRETPLGLNVNVQQDGTGKYGRHLTQAFNPESGQSINEAMTNQYNPAIYDNKGFDKKATRDKKTFLEIGKSYSDMSRDEKNQYNINKYSGSGSSEGRLGESVDMAQSSLIQSAAKTNRLLNTAIKSVGLDGVSKSIDNFFGVEETAKLLNKQLDSFTDKKTGQAAADMFTGVNKKSRQEYQGDMAKAEKQWVEGHPLDAIWTATKNLDRLAADSTGSTAELLVPYAGVLLYAANRTQDMSIEYEENNGVPMPTKQIAGNFLTAAALAVPEKLLIKSGISRLFGKKVGVLGEKAGKISKKLGVPGALAGAGVAEGFQEYGEGVHETYAAQKEGAKTLSEIATDPKQIFQGVVGSIMGTGMRGVSEAAGGVINAPSNISDKMDNKRHREIGEYLVGDDAELGQAFDDMSFADTKKSKVEVDEAREQIKEIKSFEEALESKNPLIRSIAEAQAKQQDDTDVEVGSEEHIKNAVANISRDKKAGEDLSSLYDFLEITAEKSNDEQISKAIFALPAEKRNQLLEGLDTERTNRTFAEKIKDKGSFEEVKKRISDHIGIYGKFIDGKVEQMDTQLKHVNEGRKAAPKELKEGKIDTGKIQKKEPKGFVDTAMDILSAIPNLTSKTTKEARKELNTYSNESLEEAYKSEETPKVVKKYIKDVIDKRKKVKEGVKIDNGDAYSPRNRNEALYKGDKKLTLDTLRNGLRKREYTDIRDVDAMERLIDSALEQKFITEEQGKVFKKRLNKIGEKAEAPNDDQLKQEADTDAKFTEETGFGEKTIENKASEEITREDIEKEAEELFHNNKTDKETIDEIEKIKEEDRTKEEKDSLEKLLKKVNNREDRLHEIIKDARNFTQHENDMNDAHSPMDTDWSYNKVEEVSLDSFTKKEKKALGIC